MYAAPTSLRAVNAVSEAASSADAPTAAAIPQIIAPELMPSAVA